jgi:predicted PurR-regulated permease PerM
MPRKIEISHRTIIFTILFLLGVWFLFYIRVIIIQVFVALLIMSILNPTVSKLQRWNIPKALSVLIVYLIVFVFISASIGLMVPALVNQTTSFGNNLPGYLDELKIPLFISDSFTKEVANQISRLPTYLVKISVSVFSNVFSVLTVLIFALYFLLARDKLDHQLSTLFHDDGTEKRIENIINKLEKRLGGWARAELILMFMVGFSTYIGLSLIGVPYALPLAIIAGLLELIPNVGPILSAVPAILVGLSVSLITAVATTALYILVQQVENYVLVPKVMEKSAGVPPVVTLLSLLVGFKVAGIVGALLSVPLILTSQVLLEEFLFNKE